MSGVNKYRHAVWARDGLIPTGGGGTRLVLNKSEMSMKSRENGHLTCLEWTVHRIGASLNWDSRKISSHWAIWKWGGNSWPGA